jgi:hypothetical protein
VPGDPVEEDYDAHVLDVQIPFIFVLSAVTANIISLDRKQMLILMSVTEYVFDEHCPYVIQYIPSPCLAESLSHHGTVVMSI